MSTTHLPTATHLFGEGCTLTDTEAVRLDCQLDRALARMTEAQDDHFTFVTRRFEREGHTFDVAIAMALTDVFGDDRWTRFRK